MKLQTIKQRAYDHAIRHALTMARPSVWAGQIALEEVYGDLDHGTCLYRGAGDSRCLIGAMIPDDEYEAAFEGNGIRSSQRSPLIREVVIHGLFPRLTDHEVREWAKNGDLASFLADMQNAHDRASNEMLWALDNMDYSSEAATEIWREELRGNLYDVGRQHDLRIRRALSKRQWQAASAKLGVV